jgi:hypothetical protein
VCRRARTGGHRRSARGEGELARLEWIREVRAQSSLASMAQGEHAGEAASRGKSGGFLGSARSRSAVEHWS